MHHPPAGVPSAPSCNGACPLVPAAYAGLLAAHERAAAEGLGLLTEAGVRYTRALAARGPRPEPPPGPIPRWEAGTRRLWLGDVLLKEFRRPAPHQTTLLAAFEEQSWTDQYVDDPLPRGPGEDDADARKRLHETIHNLNRGLPAGTIRFHGDGSGEGVRWSQCPPGSDPADVNGRATAVLPHS